MILIKIFHIAMFWQVQAIYQTIVRFSFTYIHNDSFSFRNGLFNLKKEVLSHEFKTQNSLKIKHLIQVL